MMQEDYRMDPHILRRVVDAESEEVVTITAEGPGRFSSSRTPRTPKGLSLGRLVLSKSPKR